MIIEVTESNYKGILIERVKDKGWKCNLGGQEYLFPYYTAAQAAIDEIFADIKPVITKNKAKKLGKKAEAQKLNPQCENCPKIAAIFEEFMKHTEADNKYENIIIDILKEQKESFQAKDYRHAEEIADSLIATLEE